MVTAQFLGKIDHNSLLVQDDYIFVKVDNQSFRLTDGLPPLVSYLVSQVSTPPRAYFKRSVHALSLSYT